MKKWAALACLLVLLWAVPAPGQPAEPQGLRLEAEKEVNRYLLGRGSGLHSSYPHSGTGYWYLSQGDEWLMYNFSLARKGRYHIWLKDFDDAKHAPRTRSVMVEVDGSPFGPIEAHTGQGGELWGWTRAATVDLEAGCHNLKIIKAQTTPAAALLDAVVISRADSRGPKPAPLPRPHPAETGQPLVKAEIPGKGGLVRIDRPGDPLHGFSIQIPAGAFPDQSTFAVSWRPIPEKLRLPPGVRAVTPLIEVDNGGGYAKELITLDIPCRIPDGYFAMPFFYDPDTGALSGLPVVKVGPRNLTAVTKHFSMFFVAMIADAEIAGRVETDFRPGKDNWPFKNYGAFTSPGGICAGMAVGAAWYYVNKAGRDNNRDLFLAFMDGLDWPHTTPEYPWDDNRAVKFAAMVQENSSYLPAQVQSYYDNHRQARPGLFDFLTFKSFYLALKLTGQPQTVFVDRFDAATGKWHGHAILATGIDADKGLIYAYDPNYSFWDFRSIEFTEGRFKPYESAANAEAIEKGHSTKYEVILYAGLDVIANYKKIDKLWQEFESGRIGRGYFPEYEFDVYDKQKKVIGQLADGLVSGHRNLWFSLKHNAPSVLRVTNVLVMEDAAALSAQAGQKPAKKVSALRKAGYVPGTRIIQVPLEEGPNRIGIKTKGRAQYASGTNVEWAGFHWFTVYLRPAQVTCYVLDGRTGKPLPGARLSLVSLDAATDSQALRAGVNGQAEFKGLDAGRYRLTSLLAGYQPLKQEVELKPGANPRLMFRLFSELAGLKVALANRNQAAPIPKATAVLTAERKTAQAEAEQWRQDVSGEPAEALFDDLPPGKYHLLVTAPGFQGHRRSLTLDQGRIHEVTVSLKPRKNAVPPPPSTTPAPKPDLKDCEFAELAKFTGRSEESATAAGVKKTPLAKSFNLTLPGPGTLRISTRVGGSKHRMSNHRYGANRFISSVHWSSPGGAIKSGHMSAGDYYFGVRDWGKSSQSIKVEKAGRVSLGFKSEACYRAKKDIDGKPSCYQCCEDYGVNGIIVLPVQFEIKVEYKPCK